MCLCETTGRWRGLNIKNVWDVPYMVVNTLHLVTHSFPNSSFLCLISPFMGSLPPAFTRPSLFLLRTHLSASSPRLPPSPILPYPFEKMVPQNCLHSHSSPLCSFQSGSSSRSVPETSPSEVTYDFHGH